jgi:predicted permease
MLIVWANLAGLSAVNAAAHGQYYAIQAALGASAGRLFRDRLADSLAISLMGSSVGVGLAYLLVALVRRYQPQFLPMLAPVSFEFTTAIVGLGLGVATGVFAALAPHGAMKRLQVGDSLRAARGSTGDRRLTAVRSALVFAQVAIAMVLIVGAGLLVRTVTNLSATSLGYRTDQLTYFHVTLPLPSYRPTERQVQFERDVRERIAAIPGVTGVSASVGFPVMGSMGARLTIMDRSQAAAPPEIAYYSVTPGFFRFLDVPVLEGRDIAETDDFPAPRVVVINQTMARMFWPEGNAIGAKVKIGAGAATDREIVVVGIAADVRQNGPAQPVRPTAYGSTLQYSWPRRHIAVKTDRRLASLAEQLRATVHAVDPAVATTAATPIDEVVEGQTARHTLVMYTLTFFGTVATVLCGLGLYATVALSSQFRRREYAIRVALGASRSRVCWLVVRQSLMLAFGGAVVGLVAASAGTQALDGLLYGVTAVDTATFTLAFVAMLVLAATSSSWPAIRAGRVDPAETLKVE